MPTFHVRHPAKRGAWTPRFSSRSNTLPIHEAAQDSPVHLASKRANLVVRYSHTKLVLSTSAGIVDFIRSMAAHGVHALAYDPDELTTDKTSLRKGLGNISGA